MTVSIICFTENGRSLAEKIREALAEKKVLIFTKSREQTDRNSASSAWHAEGTVREWAKVQMESGNALLFIGACGIAVRAVAPWLAGKLQDSPVLVMDEMGKHVIPLLSGHMGGANDLALEIAGRTGAKPVITTATDLREKFAVDLFAKRNGLHIPDSAGIAKVSSKVLAGKEITISVEGGHWAENGYARENAEAKKAPAEGIRMISYPPAGFADVVITSGEGMFDTSLLLRPREYIVGIGCRRGTEEEKVEGMVVKTMNSLRLSVWQIFALASIAQKREEPGILEWCRKNRVPFFTYTAEELQKVEGAFAESAFVKTQVGVGNVCERAALKACGPGGRLICRKCAGDGITIAVARRKWGVEFQGKEEMR